MSVEALTWAFRTVAGDSSAKLVLLAVANFSDEYGQCWPSQKRLGTMCDLSERSIRDALSRLEERGLISRAPRYREDGGRSSDLITLRPPGGSAGGGDTPRKPEDTPPRQPGGGAHPPGSAGLTTFEPSDSEPSIEPSNARAVAKAIWEDSPKAARKRSSPGQVETALIAAKKRGKNLAAIRRAVSAYFADPDIAREDHAFAKGVHRVIQNDVWETWAQGEGVEHLPVDPAFQRRVWRTWMEDWLKDQPWDRSIRGPRPDEPGCTVAVEFMAEFGYTPPARKGLGA